MSETTVPVAVRPGYYRDCDCWVYVTTDGQVYLVSTPDSPEPVWRSVGPPMSDDAEPRTPDAEGLTLLEGWIEELGGAPSAPSTSAAPSPASRRSPTPAAAWRRPR